MVSRTGARIRYPCLTFMMFFRCPALSIQALDTPFWCSTHMPETFGPFRAKWQQVRTGRNDCDITVSGVSILSVAELKPRNVAGEGGCACV